MRLSPVTEAIDRISQAPVLPPVKSVNIISLRVAVDSWGYW
jgi:hypothetical protein